MNIEIHLIQNFAPSCLNRDDTNTPKSCMFGGYRRARISSQCLKRAMRLHMRDALSIPTGVRTRRLVKKIADLLADRGRDRELALHAAQTALRAANFTFDSDGTGEPRTTVGLYLAENEIQRLAAAVDRDWEALAATRIDESAAAGGRRAARQTAKAALSPAVADAVQSIRDTVAAVDIALFGRMVAENVHMNVDAACQLAHAISTHEVETEMDFFTAVDDLQDASEEPGAGMMGIVEYNSACFYRYALINREQIIHNLQRNRELADRGITAFVRAALEAIPTARQNSSAAQNPPDYVQVRVSDGLPLSLANAFERPVRPQRPTTSGSTRSEESTMACSVAALRAYQQRVRAMYGTPDGDERWSSTEAVEGAVSVPELLIWLEGRLAEAR
jgi:CRISPR system Cascade subunit CasC